jgi:hypothetical protein
MHKINFKQQMLRLRPNVSAAAQPYSTNKLKRNWTKRKRMKGLSMMRSLRSSKASMKILFGTRNADTNSRPYLNKLRVLHGLPSPKLKNAITIKLLQPVQWQSLGGFPLAHIGS